MIATDYIAIYSANEMSYATTQATVIIYLFYPGVNFARNAIFFDTRSLLNLCDLSFDLMRT